MTVKRVVTGWIIRDSKVDRSIGKIGGNAE